MLEELNGRLEMTDEIISNLKDGLIEIMQSE